MADNIIATVRAVGEIIPVQAAYGATINLNELVDVTEVSKEDGATVVYSSSSGLYEIKKLNLDGGLF